MNHFHFIDRRKNPKGKSLGNRQRFLKRARAQIKEAVQKSLRERSIEDIDKGEKITIPSKSTAEPRFRLNPDAGERDAVHPGNKEFTPGDKIKKPPKGSGKGKGKDASPDGEGEELEGYVSSFVSMANFVIDGQRVDASAAVVRMLASKANSRAAAGEANTRIRSRFFIS